MSDALAARSHPGASLWSELRRILSASGLRLVAIDEADPLEMQGALLVSHGWSDRGARALRAGAVATALLSFESPVIDVGFYHGLARIGRPFAEAFLFPGTRRRLSPSTCFHQMFVPQLLQDVPVALNKWGDRRFLAFINANKALEPISVGRLLAAVIARYTAPMPQAVKPSVRRQLIGMIDPELRRELYSERLRAVLHFAARDDFDLYGPYWEKSNVLVSPETVDRLRPRVRGLASEKLATLQQYRFALCFENAVFPGYISEKITDCFLAGAIPIYLGAPDVSDHIPTDTFVDARRFSTYGELESALERMTMAEGNCKLRAARDFVRSRRFAPFHDVHAAEALAGAILRRRRDA